jgi:hypothetical protein
MGRQGRLIIIALLGGGVIFLFGWLYFRSNKMLQTERERLDAEIRGLRSEISKLKTKELQTRSSRDSIAAVLQPYLGYDALLRANIKRDEAYAALPFKYGDKVLLLPDSARGMISEVIMGGNPWNYYIRYKIMLKGGKESEVYPSQLVAAP